MPVRPQASNTRLRVVAAGLRKNVRYKIKATNLMTGQIAAVSEASRRGKIIKTVGIDARGVTKVEVIDNFNNVQKSYVTVGSAQIDCCIAKLVHDAINCTCKCDQCKKDLRRAQTIRLLIESAKYEATLGLEATTIEKYNKALSMCTEVCACGC
tara:strand:+ start:724 stop:1185 length:462 start_codon:yes stop_codon:yes gene_type:complete